MIKLVDILKNTLKEIKQLPVGDSIVFGVEHHNMNDAKAVVDYVKNNFTPNSFSKAFICLLKAD